MIQAAPILTFPHEYMREGTGRSNDAESLDPLPCATARGRVRVGASKQKGAALIMALLVVAIVAAIAAALIAGEQIAIKRTEFTLNADQAYLDVAYSNPWILNRLQTLDKAFKETAKVPTWPQELTMTLDDNSQINIQLWPAGMRFNLNNLAQPISNYNQIFINLLQMADDSLSGDQAKTILQNLQTQLFANNGKQPNQPNYVVSPSQLRLVAGINAKIYQALMPYLIAVPSNNIPININAAAEYLLAAVLNKDHNAAAAVIDYRNTNGSFANTGLFLGLPAVQSAAIAMPSLGQAISVQNDKYYLAHITITRDHLQYQWYSILQYAANNNSQMITTVYLGSSL